MSSSSATTTPTPFSLLAHSATSPRRCPITFLSHFSLRHRFSSVVAAANNPSPSCSSAVSWLSPPDPATDNLAGWLLPDTPLPDKNTGFPAFWVAGIGTSFTVLVAAVAYSSLSKKGFVVPFRASSSSSLSMPVAYEADESIKDDSAAVINEEEEQEVSENREADFSKGVTETPITETVVSEKHQPHMVTVAVDSTQQEAVQLLKQLKIMDEDVKADKLCTRREYARWLVRASSLLERNPKYKITPAVALAGSISSAYSDIVIGDQDFDSIQALAEAGVVLSKLSLKHRLDESCTFSPERFISRRDLIGWRALLEYDFATTGNQEILKQKLHLLDVREISSDEGQGLLMDMLAGDSSLLRRVFGQIRRLQPNKPSTVAQAAVALASGRMVEAIQNELLRLEAEESFRQVAKEEIKQELLDKREIESYWAEKMEEERARGREVEQLYIDALNYLAQEKIIQESTYNGFLKERAALDCQKQLLIGLKEEVSEMSERLFSQRAEELAEEENAGAIRCELEFKKEGVLDAKSVLEAEIEALRILRSWIEYEARKSEARSKVLEEVGRRWRWPRQ